MDIGPKLPRKKNISKILTVFPKNFFFELILGQYRESALYETCIGGGTCDKSKLALTKVYLVKTKFMFSVGASAFVCST